MSSNKFSLGSHFLSKKKTEDLTSLFTSFDKDKNGKISRSELQDMLHSAGIESTMTYPEESQGAAGGMDFEEFAKLMRPTLSDPHRLSSKQIELKEAFDAFDKDKNGSINAVELRAMMEKLGDKMTLKEAEELIKDVDLDNNGTVNFEEFCIMMGVQQPKSEPRKSPASPHHDRKRFSFFKRLFYSHRQ
ncbi:hypothetical protein BD408DRAFT_437145 [Parasitella parasitica]|nr:hypothetical protein BD408DRAFT_437145 [Parasitella parasitica]